MSISSPLLECRDLTFERDDAPLFSAVSFRLYPSRALQITGANGAGKTTLLRMLAAVLSPTEGDIRWRGQSVGRQAVSYRRDLLYVGHDAGIKASLTPRENLDWYCRLFPQLAGDADHALCQMQLQGYGDVPCQSLSAGQRRRVSLARLWLSTATLWVLDEPFTSLDTHGVALLEGLMARHLQRGGCLVLTSHQTLSLKGVEVLDLERLAVVD